MMDNLEYNQIYDLDYQQMRQALVDAQDQDICNLIFEAMVCKYYQDYPKQIWPQIEMRLFSVRADVRFIAVACLSRCCQHIEQAVFIATYLASNDSDTNVRTAAQAFVDIQND